jgi:hypothetical protein
LWTASIFFGLSCEALCEVGSVALRPTFSGGLPFSSLQKLVTYVFSNTDASASFLFKSYNSPDLLLIYTSK